ncbi:basic secretory protein-like protein [Aquimarina aquimarini]|uniref:basic secretory protein-like protein n=1 Tax=Aquimarina aquimarini TaxID=1191734 RepID=UPI000D54DAF4|nr:basic secretory protein-like protein [Aquimarina aquimarini]
MKTKTKVILGLSMMAAVMVSGKEPNPEKHFKKTESINVQPCEWGNNFLTPTIIFKDLDGTTIGSQIFHQVIPDAKSHMQQRCLDVAKILYRKSSNAPRFRQLTFELKNEDFVAYKYGDGDAIGIAVSTQHLAKIYRESGNDPQVIKDEIDGILYHEVTHGYQNTPVTGGTYDGSSPFWACLEGVADAVRIHAGFHQTRTPDPNNSRKWLGGYTTTGFFLHYVSQKYDKNFVYKFNKEAKDLGQSWSFDASFQSILGKGVEQVWNEYKNFISGNGNLDYDGVYPWVLDCAGGGGNPVTDEDITNDGGIVSDQHQDSPNGEGINQLIDNNSNTKYLTFNKSGWVQYQATKTYKLSSYTITSGNDTPERDPKNWTLEGSINGTNWTVIDQKNNQDFINRRQKRTFTVQNAGVFKSYRLTLTNNSGSILQLSEVELIGKATDIVVDAPVASFSTSQTTITEGNQVTFSNSSTAGERYEWTFAGGNPASSTERNPVIRYASAGKYDVTLKVINSVGSDVVTRRGYITVTPRGTGTCGWGNDFLTPTIIFKDLDGTTIGSQIFHQVIPDAKSHMQQRCLDVAKILYRKSSDAPRFRQLTFELKNEDFVAYKYGDGDAIGIAVSTQHLAKIYRESGNDPQVIKDEIDGILYHEVTHGYQNTPVTGGTYDGSSPFWACLEGVADAVRIHAGFHQTRTPDPNNSRRWLGGYTTTGFFLHYVSQKYDKNFVYKFNKAAKDLGQSWSFDASFQSILGKGVEQVWNEYKNYINSNGNLDYDGDYPWVLDCSGDGGIPVGEVDITNDGGIISDEHADSPAREGINNLIDNKASTKYLTFHNSGWVQYQATKTYKVASYTITSGNDAPERDPKNWSLQGSVNGNSWVTLDQRSNEDFTSRRQKRTFSVQGAAAYSYYRLSLTNNSGSILQVAEIEFFGTESTPQQVTQGDTGKSIQVSTYPNPVSETLYLKRSTELENKSVQLEVYDIQGRKVLSTVTKGNELGVQGIESKMYFIVVRYQGSVVYKTRFIKQ